MPHYSGVRRLLSLPGPLFRLRERGSLVAIVSFLKGNAEAATVLTLELPTFFHLRERGLGGERTQEITSHARNESLMHKSIDRRSFLKAAGVSAVLPLQIDAVAESLRPNGDPVASGATPVTPRQRFSMDFGWRFALGNAADPDKDFGFTQDLGFVNAYQPSDPGPHQPKFVDSAWRVVDVPHDWVSELGYDQKATSSHGCRPVGRTYPETSIGWYRKTFNLPAVPEGDRARLQFEGVFRDAAIWVNGTYFTRNESGYSPFEIDITSVANFGGPNLVTVRVDATASEGWFYEGAGIYRHVWLTITAPVHIAPWGVFVSATPEKGRAKVVVQTRILNKAMSAQSARVRSTMYDPDGKVVAVKRSNGVSIDILGEAEVSLEMNFPKPQLWDLKSPRLYRMETEIEQDDSIIDTESTSFGIRSIRFDAENGFFLNDHRVLIKGTCNHQDHAGVGVAVPDRLFAWRLEQLRAMGCNAVRCAHHQQAPAFLDACDRMGFLVLDEHRMLGAGPEVLRQLGTQVRCDRNHPSIIMYSLGNEENGVQNSRHGKRIAEAMQATIKKLDPTRPTTYAGNNGNSYAGINQVVDVRGWNYTPGKPMDDYHAAHPAQPNVATEQAGNDWWPYVVAHPHMAGGFVWSGFAYHGEANWPDVSSLYGLLDLCGYPREEFFRYQAWWREDPVVQLRGPSDLDTDPGANVEFVTYSNCDEVEILRNGVSVGRRRQPPFDPIRWTLPNPTVEGLVAIGYRDGKRVVQATYTAGGRPAAIRLTADHATLSADRQDTTVITAEIVDGVGRVVKSARNLMTFAVVGAGQIIGVGNGDPACHEPENCRNRAGATPPEPWQRSGCSTAGRRSSFRQETARERSH